MEAHLEQSAPTVRVETLTNGERGRIDQVTIDFQRKRNSLTLGLLEQLIDAVEGLASDDSLRAVVLTGAGDKAFISGANLDELAALTPKTARIYITAVHRVCYALRTLPVPVIARINGYCLGAGLEIAASCDLRLASENAVFGMPEVKVGLPSVVEAALLPRLVGWGKAAELVYLGRNYSASEAEEMGLVGRIASLENLDRILNQWLDDLLAAGGKAIRAQKALLRQWESTSLAAAIEASIEVFAHSYDSDEPKNMIRALPKTASN